MESVFEAFISNPALYSAGHLVGETLHFPTNTEEVQSLLKRIGMDGVRCQEYFIISYYNVFTVEGTAASRVFFRIVA